MTTLSLKAVGDPEVHAELARRVDAGRAVEGPPEPPPAPSVLARPATDAEMASCRSARLSANAATVNWRNVQTWFSCGPWIGVNGEVLTQDVPCLVLSCSKPGRLVRAMWINRGKWELTSAFELLPAPFRRLGGNELRPALAAE